MEMKFKTMFSEVYAVLKSLGKDYKIPQKLGEFIYNNRDINYSPEIDSTKALHEQGLSPDTIAMTALLKALYWCKDKSEMKKMIKLLEEES